MLTSFEISCFRTFSHLRIEKLGRVNLIVGRNNVGKSMLLEAFRLYAVGARAANLRALLLERDEVVVDIPLPYSEEGEVRLRVESLFHRHVTNNNGVREISLGPVGSEPLRIQPTYLRRDISGSTMFLREPLNGEELIDMLDRVPGIAVIRGQDRFVMPSIVNVQRRFQPALPIRPVFITARGIADREVASWWDAIAFRDAEDRVLESLSTIAKVERINLVEHPAKPGERIVMAKLSNEPEPVPLKSLGDGMSRIFQIALALECSRTRESSFLASVELPSTAPQPTTSPPEALVLIDEVENGIHYTALPDLWRFILRVSKIQNIQVFAASHSWDCILGLQEAAADLPDDDIMLIRLERKADQTKAVLFSQQELGIVTRQDIEVR